MRSLNYLLLLVFYLLFVQVCSNDIKTLYTYGYSYSQYIPLKENLAPDGFLRFSVRAPRDAHVLLAPTHDADEPTYEIVFGARNNSVNHIRGRCPCQEEPSATIRTVNLLSSKEFRNFWVRIKSKTVKTFVQVGLDDSDTPFHEWRDPRPLTPQYLSFRSATVAKWRYGYENSNYDTGVSKDKRQTVVTSTGFGQYFSLANVLSHSVDGVTLYFTARAKKELQVLLSQEVSTLGDVYLLCLHDGGAYLKKRLSGDVRTAYQQSNFLTGKDRLRFWIKVNLDGVIMLGKDSSLNPLLEWRDPHPLSPQYLSFTLHQKDDDDYDATLSADVQYGLGPDYTLSSQDCTARWKVSTNKLPAGAVRGGRYNDDELFVCRAKHEGDTVPGNYIVDEDRRGACYISHNFSVHQKSEFEVLTGCNMQWVSASLGHIPEGSIVGGHRKGKPKYYVIRVTHERVLIIGKLQSGERIANIPYNGQELPFTNYEVLVQSTKSDTSRSITSAKSPSPFFESMTSGRSVNIGES